MIDSEFNKKLIGFNICGEYSKRLISIAKKTFNQVADRFPLARVVLAVYGSASRGEMSAESDADLLIVTENETDLEKSFRKEFTRLLQDSNSYSKVDVPEWGDISYLKALVKTSIPEGNQVLEAVILAGDKTVADELSLLQQQFDTKERALRNLLFQKHCFNSYYDKRQKAGYINVKYSHGGTRDLLFFIYLAKLASLFGRKDLKSGTSIFDSINYLHSVGFIEQKKMKALLVASSATMLIRSESLVYNKGTPLTNLSFLNLDDDSFYKSSVLINKLYSSNADLKNNFLMSQNTVVSVKTKLIFTILEAYLPKLVYKKIATLETVPINKEDVKGFLTDKNPLVRMTAIWKTAETGIHRDVKTEILNMLKNDNLSWEEVASLASISELSAEEVAIIANKIMDIPEFGYILRIIAQHSNTPKSVLENICLKKKDPRYTKLAEIALSGKRKETNFQV